MNPQNFHTDNRNLKPEDEVFNFLRSLELERFYQNFMNAQVYSLDVLQNLTHDDLSEIGLPVGPRRTILKNIGDQSSSTPNEKKNTKFLLKIKTPKRRTTKRYLNIQILIKFRKVSGTVRTYLGEHASLLFHSFQWLRISVFSVWASIITSLLTTTVVYLDITNTRACVVYVVATILKFRMMIFTVSKGLM
eukprot:gb/GECH01010786.1/.p1 GENE.gb/GECH01010786.1/~~gb/GECH01010786.1/.p1  ORF type:complete len:191 (+),score=11.53 gb/GECH01010786.1/:1-573(+)